MLQDRIRKKSQKTDVQILGNRMKPFDGYKRKLTI